MPVRCHSYNICSMNLRTAIVVDYLNQYGGAERTLEAILEIFPECDIYTSLYDASKIPGSSIIKRSRIFSSPLNLFPFIKFLSKHFTFLYPLIFEKINLDNYDLIISSGTIWAKGIKKNPSQLHIFYCHTPARFLYGYPSESSRRNIWYYKPFVTILDHILRIWDFKSAQKPDYIIANSENVKRRISKFYRRESMVIYPPVSHGGIDPKIGIIPFQGIIPITPGYFLVVSRLSAYKNIDIAIKAFNELKLNLKIVGVGREEKKLKEIAGPTVEFLGFTDDEQLAKLYSGCQAFIYTTSDEDFGITPLEANSFGKPVIAFRSGGVLETMIEGKTAVFFNELSSLSLIEAVRRFREGGDHWNADLIRKNSERFSKERFKKEFKDFVEDRYNKFN